MAIPAHRACGRNIMGEGISSGLFRFLFFKTSDVHFQGVSPFSSDICKADLFVTHQYHNQCFHFQPSAAAHIKKPNQR